MIPFPSFCGAGGSRTPFPYFTDNLYSSNYCFSNWSQILTTAKLQHFFHIIHLYTKLFFQSFHCTFRDIGELGHLPIRIPLPQQFQGFPILSLFLVLRFPVSLTTETGFPSQGYVLLNVSLPSTLQSEHDVLPF